MLFPFRQLQPAQGFVTRLSEDDLIARLFAPLAGPAGLGLRDDAACFVPPADRDVVITKDMLVAGVHFFPDDPPGDIARKALRVNLSDLAAKGAEPFGFLLGLGLPAEWTEPWLAAFAQALGEDAAAFGCPLVGGDTVKAPTLTLSITAFGSVPHARMVPRAGVQPGDILFVTGTIGDAALGLRIRRAEAADRDWIAGLDQDQKAHLCARYLLPQPRLGLAEALRSHAHAAMDISDGLAGDLAKLLGLGEVSADIMAADLPLSGAARRAVALAPQLLETVLSGGDDYEILSAVPLESAAAFAAAAGAAGIGVTRIGHAEAGPAAPRFRDSAGSILSLRAAAFQHF